MAISKMLPNITHYVQANRGPSFWGPGDRYTFLVTGEQSGGAYFIMEALVPPGGGPPPHTHENEEESFYVLEGQLHIRVEDRVIEASAGDFIHTPRRTVHCFKNVGTGTARLLLIFSPAGLEKFFEETLEPVLDLTTPQPENLEAVVDRYVVAAPKYGLRFLV
jgi:quercetin dioxygenase-like cupin family protein